MDYALWKVFLGPTLANFFMAHLEQKFFSDKVNDPLLPQLYLRYVTIFMLCLMKTNTAIIF